MPVIQAPKRVTSRYPLLDETILIKALLTEISPENIDQIRSGAVLSIIAAFDRRIPRTQFLEIVATALPMYDWLGCLQTVQRIDMIKKKQKLTDESLAEATTEYQSRSDATRRALLERMKAIVACAPSDETLH